MARKKPDIERVSLRMEAIWNDAEERIMQDVVRRIRQYGKITSTADYQINRLIEIGKSTEEIEKVLKEALNATYPEMYKLYDDVSNWQYVRNKDVYEQVNGEFIPPEENEQLIQISSAIKKQTADELKNLAQSYGFAVLMSGKKVFMPFAEYYQKYVDAAIMDIISGGYDYNTVIRRVVTQMTNSGLRTVDYASGWSNRTPVAVRRAVMTGVAQITGKVAEHNANALGTDHYEVDWHSGARPEHRVWQGKVYSYEQLISVCGLGTVTGLHGANCYHDYYPFVPGVSERLYTDEWLEEQNRKEEQTKTWMGKEYNVYEQTQKQRQMETAMRAQREKVSLLKEAKASDEEIMLARAKYQAQLDEYGRFCKKMGLQQQRERIYYDMRGRVAPRIKYYTLSDSTDKWSKETRKELLMSEKSLGKRQKETMEIYDSSGKYIMTKRGDSKSVRLSVLDYGKLKNAVVSHNHPTGGSFSVDDIRFLKNTPISELRVAVVDGAYYMRKPKEWPEEINSTLKIQEEIEKIRKSLIPKYKKMYNDGKINKVERSLLLRDEVNKVFCRKHGIEYGYESYE